MINHLMLKTSASYTWMDKIPQFLSFSFWIDTNILAMQKMWLVPFQNSENNCWNLLLIINMLQICNLWCLHSVCYISFWRLSVFFLILCNRTTIQMLLLSSCEKEAICAVPSMGADSEHNLNATCFKTVKDSHEQHLSMEASWLPTVHCTHSRNPSCLTTASF